MGAFGSGLYEKFVEESRPPRRRRKPVPTVPVVGSQQLHPVQVSQPIRELEAHRTREAARRESAPVLAADREAFAAAKKQYRAEAASARGATNAVESSLAQALAGLKGSGLSGRYLQQTKNEFTSRAANAASSLPFLLAGAAEERGKAFTEARSQLSQDRAAMQQSGASAFDQRLKELRGAGTTAVKEQEADHELSKDETKSFQNATNALKDFLSQWGENIDVKDPTTGELVPIQQVNPLKTADQWKSLAHGLESHYSGFDITDAIKAIHAFLTRRKKASTEDVHATGSVPIGG